MSLKPPTGWMPVTGPVRRTEPPSSASSPRPRTKMRLGALTLTSSLTTLGRDPATGVPSRALARRSVSRTAFDGVDMLDVERCRASPSVSGTVISARSTVMLPDSNGSRRSGPVIANLPLKVATTRLPSA